MHKALRQAFSVGRSELDKGDQCKRGLASRPASVLGSTRAQALVVFVEPPPGLEPGTYSLRVDGRVDGACVASRVHRHLRGFLLELVFLAHLSPTNLHAHELGVKFAGTVEFGLLAL